MLFILALLFLVGAAGLYRFRQKAEFPLSKRLAPFQWGALAVGTVLFIGSMFVIVPVGHVGVKELFGKVDEDALMAGPHLINPLKSVRNIDVRTRNYTMSLVSEEGGRKGDDSISVITLDQLQVRLDVTILYALEPARCPEIYRTIGLDVDEKIVRSGIRTALRDSAAAYSASDLYTTKRAAFVDQVDKTLRDSLDDRGIRLEQVLLRNVTLPDQITKAINDKLAADQEAQKMASVLLKEKQEAERKRIEAEGQARSQQIVSQSLTPQILEYQRIQALREIGAKGNLIITPAGGAAPLIQVPARK